MSTAVALLAVLAGMTPCLGLTAYRLWQRKLRAVWARAALRLARRQLQPVGASVSCQHMSISAGAAIVSMTCHTCGPLPVTRTYQTVGMR